MARDAGRLGSRLTQQLAGGPLLLQRYAELEPTDPLAHAVLMAAMDVRRIGYQSPLPPALLAAAVPGYLSREQLAVAPDWFTRRARPRVRNPWSSGAHRAVPDPGAVASAGAAAARPCPVRLDRR